MKKKIGYRVDGGVQSYYTSNLKDAENNFDSIEEEFGEACIFEIIEKWDEQENDWILIEENIMMATNPPTTEIDYE